MSGVSELPASGHLSTPDVNIAHMAEGNNNNPNQDSVLALHISPNHAMTLLADLRGQRDKAEYCDVVLHVNDDQLYAHRCVLATYGSFFHNIFTQNQTNEPQHLSFPSTNVHVLRSVLEFIYSGSISVSLSDVDELLALSTTLEIKQLGKSCFEAMQTHLDISNWFEIKQLASKHNIPDLTHAVVAYIAENFAFTKDDKRLVDLDVKDMLVVCKRCNLNGDKDVEGYRFQLIVDWINHDYESRESYYAEIMQTVNPDNLDSSAIRSFLSFQTIKGSKICEHFVTHALIKFVDDREKFEEGETASATSKEVFPPEQIAENDSKKVTVKEQSEAKTSNLTNSDQLQTSTEMNRDEQKEPDKIAMKVNDTVPISTRDKSSTEQSNAEDNKKQTIKGTKYHRTAMRKSQRAEERSEEQSEGKETAKVGDKSRTISKAKRGRPRKTLGTETLPEVTVNQDDVKKEPLFNEKPAVNDETVPAKIVKKRRTRQKTISTQTATENDNKTNVFPPMNKRPRSKKITPDTPRLNCPKCPRSFPTDCQLGHHMKGHGSDTPFLCDTCGFTTIHFGSMNVHRKLHDESQMLSCTWPGCTYKAIRRSRLEDHLNMHTGSKVYICATCGKGFSGRKHLHRHEKLHVDTKPFMCDDCEYSSVRKDKLKDHVKKHHPLKAVEKGWLTETEAAKVRPTIRHRPKANVTGDGQDTSQKDKKKQQPSRKNPVQFENLVEELLKAHESQQEQEKQQKALLCASENSQRFERTSTSLNKPDLEPMINQQPLQHNSNQTTTTQAHHPEPPKLQIQSMTEQNSPQIRHQHAPENPHLLRQAMNSEARLAFCRNSIPPQPQSQTNITEGIQNPSDQIQSVIRYEQPVPQVPGTVSDMPNTSHQYANIPTSSTLSEEVLQFITYPGHSGRVSGNGGQFQAASPISSSQPQMETMTSPVSNLQQESNNVQLQYQVQHQGPIPQNTTAVNGNQWS